MDISLSLRLTDNLFTYTGELVAISTGIHYAIENNIQHSVIVSDCLGVVKDMESNNSSIRPFFISCLREDIHASMLDFSLVWVPSHSGVDCHDVADSLSKLSLLREVDVEIPFEIKEAESRINFIIDREWKHTWNSIHTGLSYKNVFGLLDHGFLTQIKPRYKEKIISRLRSQSCGLKAYLFKIGLHGSGLCENCRCPETVEHFIVYCPCNLTLQLKLKDSCKLLKLDFNLKNCLSACILQDIVIDYITKNDLRL